MLRSRVPLIVATLSPCAIVICIANINIQLGTQGEASSSSTNSSVYRGPQKRSLITFVIGGLSLARFLILLSYFPTKVREFLVPVLIPDILTIYGN